MANNPYSPPTAEVTDRLEPVGGRPRTVLVGTGILAVLGAYSLLGFSNFDFAGRLEALRGQSLYAQAFVFLPATLLLVQVVVLVFTFLRRRWARITLVVLAVWALLSIIAGAVGFFTLRRGTFPDLVEIYLFTWTLFVIRAVALGLLFTPSANTWFRAARRTPKHAPA